MYRRVCLKYTFLFYIYLKPQNEFSDSFDYSKAQKDDKFVGLGIDNDNEPELTEERVEAWCKQIESEFA